MADYDKNAPPYNPSQAGYGYPHVGGQPMQGYAPPPASNTTVIVQQPTAMGRPTGAPRAWGSELFSCFDDMGVCLCGTFCGLCLLCQVSSDMGESPLVPCCVPVADLVLRVRLRSTENIDGTIMSDCCTVMCCGPCALCQLAREVKVIKARTGGLRMQSM